MRSPKVGMTSAKALTDVYLSWLSHDSHDGRLEMFPDASY